MWLAELPGCQYDWESTGFISLSPRSPSCLRSLLSSPLPIWPTGRCSGQREGSHSSGRSSQTFEPVNRMPVNCMKIGLSSLFSRVVPRACRKSHWRLWRLCFWRTDRRSRLPISLGQWGQGQGPSRSKRGRGDGEAGICQAMPRCRLGLSGWGSNRSGRPAYRNKGRKLHREWEGD